MILHRNYGSPYCEKAMLMLGYSGLNWYSVLTSKGMPRPVQQALAGDYSRRVPLLQLGADIYCDTDLIMSQIAERSAMPELARKHAGAGENQLIEMIETQGTAAMLGSLSPLHFICGYFKNLPFHHALDFLKDRAKLAKQLTSDKNAKPRKRWRLLARDYLNSLEEALSGQLYLHGDQSPGAADFSAYTMVWYHYQLTRLGLFRGLTRLKAWFGRMSKISYGNSRVMTPAAALQAAKASEPAVIPGDMKNTANLNREITVLSNDLLGTRMNNRVTGILVGENSEKYILKRVSEQVGKVHIHIPKHCYGACG
ncbi:glutathione S-transferase family protein [Thalassomonas viridans]|uniref:Glutathione S-transferase family protein n=1 Tax=Thalassomonas viridans TaxID=137584 RepID=A0AAE9Z622_9GAMM|nr:glutathione S-transferase family protein [Thalassomonas viridans]WDE07416.1 glutathione S-transferase family protein [Thalassomonas viridans]